MEGWLGPTWSVPLEYVLVLISAFVAILAMLWAGVVVRVFVNVERRLLTLEEYKRNEDVRTQLLITEVKKMLLEHRLEIGRDLEAKRSSIEGTITRKVSEVVEALKNGDT